MSLIEGIGDEVTIVLACFSVAVVVILAWFSTSIADPLLREVGVIVVELGQRRNRTQQGEDGRPDFDQQSSSETERTQQEAEQPVVGAESASTTDPGQAGASLLSTTESVPEAGLPVIQEASVSSGCDFSVEIIPDSMSENDYTDDDPPTSHESGLEGNPPNSDYHPREEEMRRRRVQYFQQDLSTRSSESGEFVACNVVTGVDDAVVSEEHQGAAKDSQKTVPVDSDSQNHASSGINSNVIKSEQTVNESSASATLRYRGVTGNSTEPPLQTQQQTVSSSLSEGIDSPNLQQTSDRDSQIRIRLKYMNETQRIVSARLQDTIGDFRRSNFQTELEENKWVRFIFNGQDLRDDTRTLQSFGIVDNCTVHCLITTQNQPPASTLSMADDDGDSLLGAMMYPLFTVVLLIVWYLRFTYRQYFSSLSTICLIGISFLLALSYISSLRPGDAPQPPPTADGQNSRRHHPHTD